VIYQRAKMVLRQAAVRYQEDVYKEGYEWMHHSMAPKAHTGGEFRVSIGGPDCARPYSASVFNISAMSFGALSPNAVRALNAGAKKGGFAHDTGEGGVSPYHRENGGDIIWEVGSGYFRLPQPGGSFNPELLRKSLPMTRSRWSNSRSARAPSPDMAACCRRPRSRKRFRLIRGVPMGGRLHLAGQSPRVSTPLEMMAFIGEMRRLSGGKPAGFKLCIGHKWEFLAICKAMLQTGIYPDFIVVDGNEGGTGAAPLEFMDHLGVPMREGVNFVHNALIGINARDRIRVGASGKIATAFDMARAMAIGADLVQFGARLHVLARLHPVAELPYRPLSDRGDHAGSIARACAGGAAQDRTRLQLSPCDADALAELFGRGRSRTSTTVAADPFFAAKLHHRGADIRKALSVAAPRRIARRHQRSALSRRLGNGAGGFVSAGFNDRHSGATRSVEPGISC